MTFQLTLDDVAPRRRSRSAQWAWRFASFAAPVLVVGLLAHRSGYADTTASLAVFASAFLMGAIAVVFAVAAFVSIWDKGGRGFGKALMSLVVGLAVISFPIAAGIQIWRLPPINDITTDPDALPAFQALAGEREAVGAPVEYGGADMFLEQIEAYPTVVPLRFETEFPVVLDIVTAQVRKSGWRIVSSRVSGDQPPRTAVIEAVATTPVFSFTDDVMIKVTEVGDVVRIDMRSASRIGELDLGTNARRITGFLGRVEKAVKDHERV